MEVIDHELNRRVSGLRIFCIVIGAICLLNLIRWMLAPTSEMEFVNKAQMIVNLCYFLYSLYLFQYLNKSNYSILLSSFIVLYFSYYLIGNYLSNMDNNFSNPDQIGLGRAIDYNFLFPMTMIVISPLFQRQSLVILSILFFTGALVYENYPDFANAKTFITNDWEEIITNGYAINFSWLIVTINVWIIICVVSWAGVFLQDRSFSDAVKFEKSTAQLSKYFSPDIRDKIQEAEIDIETEKTNNQMVAVLFTDIQGFTSISESLTADEVIQLLSEYQDKMIKPIFQNSGTVDKFIGDAVMATFGTPVSQGNDAQNAFNCAREMQIAMRQWAKERTEAKLPVIKHRIGIHFGNCIVGNVGNDDLKEFTVIGDIVNVANRVCDACKELNADFVITEELRLRLNEEIQSKNVKGFEIRGKKEKLDLHIINV